MNITVIEAPDDTALPVALAGRFNPESGSALILFSATDTTETAIVTAVLTSLGKNLTIRGTNAVRSEEKSRYVRLWVQAHELHTIVVGNAQAVPRSTIAQLVSLASTVRNLYLVTEPTAAHATTTALARDGHVASSGTWKDMEQRFPAATPRSPEATPGYTMDHLPQSDFTLFRAACKTHNTPGRFARIDQDYTRSYWAATDVEPGLKEVIAHLDRVTAAATTTAPMLVAVRATQQALFDRGHLLQAHPELLLGTLSSIRPPQPTSSDWLALRAYTRPERAATAALYLLSVPTQELQAVTVTEVDQGLTTGRLREAPINDLARPLLRAQLLRRRAEGAADSQSYLNLRGNRRHLEILIDARRDCGLPIDGRNLRDDDTAHTHRPLYRLGLKIGALT